MFIYHILLVGLTAIGVLFCKKHNFPDKSHKTLVKIYLFITFSVFFIVAAIRETTGYDYNLYATWYHNLIRYDYDWVMAWSREKGFTVPLKILTVITYDYQPMFVIISFIVALGVGVYIYKNSSSAFISVAAFLSMGLFYNSMNFMRQFIAAIIVSFALNCIQSKQFVRYLVLVLFASCFHFSALLMIPFFFILMIRMNIIVLGIYSAVAAVSFIFSVPVIEFVTEYFYAAYDPVTSVEMTIGIPVQYPILFGILFILFFLFRKDLIKKRELNSIFINTYFFAVYFEFIGIKHAVISRFALLFLIAPLLALVPDLLSVITDKIKAKCGNETLSRKSKGRLFTVLAVIAFCIYGFSVHTYLLYRNYNGVVPYQTIYDNRV